jgi:hypothetical protein
MSKGGGFASLNGVETIHFIRFAHSVAATRRWGRHSAFAHRFAAQIPMYIGTTLLYCVFLIWCGVKGD